MSHSELSAQQSPLDEILAQGQVAPRYRGRSIANLPATVGHLLGVDFDWAAPALDPSLLGELNPSQRVIVFLLDGVGWNRLESELRRSNEQLLRKFAAHARLYAPITSITPATTTVATTVLLGDGSGPAQTGMLGYTFLLPQLGVLANMLLWKPVGNPSAITGEIERWGVEPEGFLPTPSLAGALKAGGVNPIAFLPANISATPLSRMQFRGSTVAGYLNWPDLWDQLRQWSQECTNGRQFAYVYLPDFDAMSHRDGPNAPLWGALWQRWLADFEAFVAQLARPGKAKTTILVTADHGHVTCPRPARVEIQDHPALTALLAVPPGGEARHVNLYARGGYKEELLAYCRQRLSASFQVLDAHEALNLGLYGSTERIHPETAARLGDVLLLSKGPTHLWDRQATGSMLGMHGSLEPDEMLVPLLALEI